MRVDPATVIENAGNCVAIINIKTGRVQKRVSDFDVWAEMYKHAYVNKHDFEIEYASGATSEAMKIYTEAELNKITVPGRINIANAIGAKLETNPVQLTKSIMKRQADILAHIEQPKNVEVAKVEETHELPVVHEAVPVAKKSKFNDKI